VKLTLATAQDWLAHGLDGRSLAMELRPGLKDVRRPAALMDAHIVLSLLCGLRTEEARDSCCAGERK
jgi:hypothetical protein